MFADRSKNIRNQVNSWFFSEQINVEQLRNLNFEVDKLVGTSKQQRELLSLLISKPSYQDDLILALKKVDITLGSSDISLGMY